MLESDRLSRDKILSLRERGFYQQRETEYFNCRIVSGNGKITSKEGMAICSLAEEFGQGEIAFTNRQTVEIIGVPMEHIEELEKRVKKKGILLDGSGPRIRPVVGCKGTNCRYGLLDTFLLTDKIHRLFFVRYYDIVLPNQFKIAVAGCANQCVKPELNDIGIVGQMVPKFLTEECRNCENCSVVSVCEKKAVYKNNGKAHIFTDKCTHCGLCIGECPYGALNEGILGYRVYVGGRWGRNPKPGKSLSKLILGEEQLLSVIEKAIALYQENGQLGENFADVVQRMGMEELEKRLLG